MRAAIITLAICAFALFALAAQRVTAADATDDAIAAINDTLAMAMIKRLTEDGIRVPDQISIVGYDDDVVTVDNRPFLSTVRVNKKELGRIGAELILKRVMTPASPVVKLRLPVEFIARDSVAPPPERR